jgi:hypothetical protein
MIKNYIENLKTRSYAEKSNFAFVTSLVLTGIIAAVWFLTIFANPEAYFNPQDTEAQKLANTGSLFDSLKEGLK